MKLFLFERMLKLPCKLKISVMFNLVASCVLAAEGTIIMIVQVESLPYWSIPLIGVVYSLSILLSDKASEFDLSVVYLALSWCHYLTILSWILILIVSWKFIWVLIAVWVFDGIAWTSEDHILSEKIAKSYPDDVKEYSRVNSHNKILPMVCCSILASVTLKLNIDYTIVLVIFFNLIMVFSFVAYKKAWTS